MSDGINLEKPLIIYLIAGEPSGDFLGAQLMKSLKNKSGREILFYGIGGKKMEEEGLSSLFPYQDLSMMGFVEILPHIPRTIAHINSTIADITIKQPDMVITIDSPGFCFRVVEKLRKADFQSKFIHYVAPTVWAYKEKRAEKCAKLFDHMFLLLPFEKPYFDKVGLDTTFIGHPAICERTSGNGKIFREKHNISENTLVLCLLPGSRKGEINRHMPVFARAVSMLSICYPNIAVTVAVPEYALPFLAPYLNNCPFRALIAEDEEDKKNAIAASNFAIVKSGTVSFEVAKAGVPMLISYRINKISAWLLRKILLIKFLNVTKYVNIINILLKKEAVPELLQEHCHPLILASCANYILRTPEKQNRQKHNIEVALKQLIPESGELPSNIAADKILSFFSAKD